MSLENSSVRKYLSLDIEKIDEIIEILEENASIGQLSVTNYEENYWYREYGHADYDNEMESQNLVSGETMGILINAIRNNEQLLNSQLTSLSLYDVHLEPEAQLIIADFMGTDNVLLELNLQMTLFNTKAAVDLANSLKTNSTLQHLHLGTNNIESEGFKAISNSLLINQTLQSLNLSENSKGGLHGGGEAIKEMLENNSTLKLLDISSCDISHEDVIAILDVLATKNSSLRSLDIDQSDQIVIDSQVVENLIRSTNTLTYINFGKISEIDIDVLKNALSENFSLNRLRLYFKRGYDLNSILESVMKKNQKIKDKALQKTKLYMLRVNMYPYDDFEKEALRFYKAMIREYKQMEE